MQPLVPINANFLSQRGLAKADPVAFEIQPLNLQ
jgi:hypothetical protein